MRFSMSMTARIHAAPIRTSHENFGFGEIGFEALMQVVNCPDFEQIPKILETPYIPDAENKKKSYAPYKFEIEMIRKGLFDAQLKEKILQAAK